MKKHILSCSNYLSMALYEAKGDNQEKEKDNLSHFMRLFLENIVPEIKNTEDVYVPIFQFIEDNKTFIRILDTEDFYFKMQKTLFSLEDLDESLYKKVMSIILLYNNYLICKLRINANSEFTKDKL